MTILGTPAVLRMMNQERLKPVEWYQSTATQYSPWAPITKNWTKSETFKFQISADTKHYFFKKNHNSKKALLTKRIILRLRHCAPQHCCMLIVLPQTTHETDKPCQLSYIKRKEQLMMLNPYASTKHFLKVSAALYSIKLHSREVHFLPLPALKPTQTNQLIKFRAELTYKLERPINLDLPINKTKYKLSKLRLDNRQLIQYPHWPATSYFKA